ncbi:MAG TPA: hypothetical protein VHC97_27695 [Thermoanaerobaculia bacterium]|jgi:uncharacterized membrane protein|nr:hypothetical protein [Thermoanaerobaculia bacterium]
MQLDVFNYRDYVPALVLKVEAKRLEDFLQSDFSRPAEVKEEDLPASAQAVLDGLARMVEDFRARPVASETLEAAKAGVREDLRTSLQHERDFKKSLRDVQKSRAQAVRIREPELLSKIDALTAIIKRELHISRRMSAAYRGVLEDLNATPAKVLTPQAQEQVAWMRRRIAALEEFQERIKENPAEALNLSMELQQQFRSSDPPPPGLNSPGPPPSSPDGRPRAPTKTISQRIDEKAALGILGASLAGTTLFAVAGPAACLLGVIIGATIGVSVHPWLEERERKG